MSEKAWMMMVAAAGLGGALVGATLAGPDRDLAEQVQFLRTEVDALRATVGSASPQPRAAAAAGEQHVAADAPKRAGNPPAARPVSSPPPLDDNEARFMRFGSRGGHADAMDALEAMQTGRQRWATIVAVRLKLSPSQAAKAAGSLNRALDELLPAAQAYADGTLDKAHMRNAFWAAWARVDEEMRNDISAEQAAALDRLQRELINGAEWLTFVVGSRPA